MPYAPTVNDNSGQILAQGINQGIAGLADGIQRSIQERKKKEEERRAKEAVNAAGKGLFGEDFDVKDAKPEQYPLIIQFAQQKKEEPMRALALENEGLKQRISQSQLDQYAVAAEQQARNQAALRGAFNPTTGTAQAIQGGADFQNLPGPNAMDAESAMRYMGAQGADAATMQNYSQTVENMAQAKQRSQPKPEKSISYLNPPEGAQWMKDENGNLHNLTPKRDPNARREFEVGGRKMVEESGKVFDGNTGELVGAAKPLDPDTQSRLATRLSAAQTEAEKPKGMFESAADYAKRVRDARMKANLAASTLGYAPPYEDALTPQGQVAAPKPAAARFTIVPEPSK
jgi:hypothetical protein